MTNNRLNLFCLVDGESTPFPIEIESTKTFGDLKKAIKAEKANDFSDVDADKLKLWKVSISVPPKKERKEISLPTPSNGFHPGKPLCDEHWRNIVSAIESQFFASDIMEYARLVEFVKGSSKIPTTKGDLGGLPCIQSSETQDPPSTADIALKKIRKRAIPLLPFFGVTGCGKTRTAIEILSKNWGFYFNGSGTDLGSADLVYLLERAQKRCTTGDMESNAHVHIMALALVLTRIIILHHWLDIAEREKTTFTCKDWMLFQVGIRTMGVKDLFATLFALIMTDVDNYFIGITPMTAIVQDRFSKLRQRLLDLTFHTSPERFDYKILFVVDEAQTLGKKEFGTYLSQQVSSASEGQARAASPDYSRPVLSPLVHGLYLIAADKNEFCVIPCGTGLGIFDMRWLEDSAPGPKGHKDQLGPFTDFVGWRSIEEVQNYRDLVRSSLPKDEARTIFDSHVPLESISELYVQLCGRFRPIVFAIERMIMLSSDNGVVNWRKAIDETDKTLTSTESQHYAKGNIAYDIARMVRRVHEIPSRYEKYQNIQTTLKAFALHHYLEGRALLLNQEEAPLVEASVGRIFHFGEEMATILDEPFALRAAVNYFRLHDPSFHSALCMLLGSGTNASVHGHQWEMAVLPTLAHLFHDKILSQTDLVPKGTKSFDPVLDGKAEIVGYVNHLTLGTSFESMSLGEFLNAHVYHGSRKDKRLVPPFYRPAEMPKGPDVAFVLHIDGHGYCSVFVQLKLRNKMTKAEAQYAFSTVKSNAVQGHLEEAMLQMFCTGRPKRFFGVVVAYPAELAGVEGTFPEVRQSQRIRSAQGKTPQCVSLRIDKNNIHDLFPEKHMQALDLLKGIKRQLEQPQEGGGSDDQVDEPAMKQRRYEE
ncbi:hypothetical protein EDD11_006559 [Mortierella claussenii]|nr:hypothetical protein EDD11_006559 [Mortierella claussenii]